MRAANLALKFLLELGAVAAFAYWGATTGEGAMSAALAVAVPAVMIVSWGVFAAPKAQRRLEPAARVPFELGVFAVAVAALLAADAPVAAGVFGVAVLVNAALLTTFRQWDR